MGYKFEIKNNSRGEPYVRFMYNGEPVFVTESYSSKANARNAIDSVKKNGPGAPTEDNT